MQQECFELSKAASTAVAAELTGGRLTGEDEGNSCVVDLADDGN